MTRFKSKVLQQPISIYIVFMFLIGCATTSGPVYIGRTMFIPIETSPTGARVIFDGKEEGFTPLTLRFSYLQDPRGNHDDETRKRTIKIEKEGYEPYVITFSIAGGEHKEIPRPIHLRKIDNDDSVERARNGERKKRNEEKTGEINLKGIRREEMTESAKQPEDTGHTGKNFHSLSVNEWFEKGLALGKSGKYTEEIGAYDKVIEMNPGYAMAYNNRGIAYRKLGNYQRAIEDYNRAIELNPEDADVYINRGIAYKSLRNKTASCLDWKNACALGNCKNYDIAKERNYCE